MSVLIRVLCVIAVGSGKHRLCYRNDTGSCAVLSGGGGESVER